MRIISGTHKGKRINPPKNLPVRPTTDFAKEGLFNILNNKIDFEETIVLDLFAGTGSISLEFASRQAKQITSIDSNYHCTEFIRKIATELQYENLRAIKANVFNFLSNKKIACDLIFADPPYDMAEIEQIPELIFKNEILNKDGIFILEHSRKFDFSEHPRFTEHRKYGNVNFSFFK